MEKYTITPHLDNRNDLFRWTVLLHNEVNKVLKKPPFTETQAIQYYTRLGARGRSPVYTPNDFLEADYVAFLRGLGLGIGVCVALGGAFWLLEKS